MMSRLGGEGMANGRPTSAQMAPVVHIRVPAAAAQRLRRAAAAYPVTQALLGPAKLPDAIFYDVFGTVGALVFVGLLVAQHYGDNEEARVNPLRELFTFPAVIALLVGLALRPVAVPELVGNGLELLANMVAPLIMLSVGMSLRVSTLGRAAVPLGVLGVLRLVVASALGWGVGMLVLGPGAPLQVAVLEAGMASMMLTLVVGERFGLDTDFRPCCVCSRRRRGRVAQAEG